MLVKQAFMVLQTNKTKGRIKQDIMLLQGNKIKRKYAYLNISCHVNRLLCCDQDSDKATISASCGIVFLFNPFLASYYYCSSLSVFFRILKLFFLLILEWHKPKTKVRYQDNIHAILIHMLRTPILQCGWLQYYLNV